MTPRIRQNCHWSTNSQETDMTRLWSASQLPTLMVNTLTTRSSWRLKQLKPDWHQGKLTDILTDDTLTETEITALTDKHTDRNRDPHSSKLSQIRSYIKSIEWTIPSVPDACWRGKRQAHTELSEFPLTCLHQAAGLEVSPSVQHNWHQQRV